MPITAVADLPLYYGRHFAVVRATTPELLRKAYRLRYQVYCVENSFEDPGQQIDQSEIDQYDEYAVHTLLVHRRTGEVVGTSRVILPHKGEFGPLPMATLLHEADRRRFDEFPAAQTAEISRFAVSKHFRRRYGEARYADAGFAENATVPEISERRLMPFITLGLLGGVLDICLEHEITHLAAVMEPPLIRILRRLGLDFMPIGGLVEHHGLRQPCIARLADLIQHGRDNESLVWQYVSHTLAEQGTSIAEPGGAFTEEDRANRRAIAEAPPKLKQQVELAHEYGFQEIVIPLEEAEKLLEISHKGQKAIQAPVE
jgi:N-acyl amino acid synthase of PEP-CTERM/exosortase system